MLNVIFFLIGIPPGLCYVNLIDTIIDEFILSQYQFKIQYNCVTVFSFIFGEYLIVKFK